MNECKVRKCPECADRLVHQNFKSMHESSTGYGQHIHDDYPQEFFFIDGDADTMKNRTRIRRKIEHKKTGERISKGQQEILPMDAISIQTYINIGLLSDESGVFILCSDPPYKGPIRVRRLKPQFTFEMEEEVVLSGDAMRAFETGEVLPPPFRDRLRSISPDEIDEFRREYERTFLEITGERAW